MTSHSPNVVILGLLLSPLFAASATAQKTWIVDAANGAGTHYTDLPPALTAAKDGDRIVVRKGDYTVATTGKGLTLIGEPGARLGKSKMEQAFVIQGLPKGKRFSMQGFSFTGIMSWIPSKYLLEVSFCQGQVHLANLTITSPSARHATIYVNNSSSVTMHDCHAKPGAVFENSHVSCSNSSFSAFEWNQGPIYQGLSCYKTTLEMTQCYAKGSDGSGHSSNAAGLRSYQSTLVIRGDKSSRFVGGTYPQSGSAPSLQDDGNNELLLDPTVTLSPPLKGFPKAMVRRIPAVTSTGGALGSSLTARLYSPQGDLYLMLGSTPMPALVLPGLGTTWMQAAPLFLIASGVQGKAEVQQWTLPVPNRPELRGVAIALQAISGPAPKLSMSNPSVPVLH